MTALRNEMQVVGGYEGPSLLQAEYLGLGLFIVVVPVSCAWRRDRRLWFFGALGVIALVASLGRPELLDTLAPADPVPLVQNVCPDALPPLPRSCVAIVLAVVVDRTHSSVGTWVKGLGARRSARHGQRRRGALTGALAGGVALVVSAVAVVPIGSALASNAPLTTRAVTLPAWFSHVAPHLPPGQVVLTYPAPFALQQSAEAWQAVDSLAFRPGGGSGPGGILAARRQGAGGPGGDQFRRLLARRATASDGCQYRRRAPGPGRLGCDGPRDSQPLLTAPLRTGYEPSLSPRPLYARPRPPTAIPGGRLGLD